MIETHVAPTSPTANRNPGAVLFALSRSVIVRSAVPRSNATTTYLPRSIGAAFALPNTPFFIMCTTTPSESWSTRIGARYGSGDSVNDAEMRPDVQTASAAGSAPRTSQDMIHAAPGS